MPFFKVTDEHRAAYNEIMGVAEKFSTIPTLHIIAMMANALGRLATIELAMGCDRDEVARVIEKNIARGNREGCEAIEAQAGK